MALLLAEDRHRTLSTPTSFLAAGLYVECSALQAELRLNRVLLAWYRYAPQSVRRDVLPELRADLIEVSAASTKHLAHHWGIENREQ